MKNHLVKNFALRMKELMLNSKTPQYWRTLSVQTPLAAKYQTSWSELTLKEN